MFGLARSLANRLTDCPSIGSKNGLPSAPLCHVVYRLFHFKWITVTMYDRNAPSTSRKISNGVLVRERDVKCDFLSSCVENGEISLWWIGVWRRTFFGAKWMWHPERHAKKTWKECSQLTTNSTLHVSSFFCRWHWLIKPSSTLFTALTDPNANLLFVLDKPIRHSFLAPARTWINPIPSNQSRASHSSRDTEW